MAMPYKSKQDIYEDYLIAVKFVLKPISPDAMDYFQKQNYTKVRALLAKLMSAKITEIDGSISNFEFEYPLSTAFMAEFPITEQSGELLGVKTIVLEHESGPEFFLMLDQLAIAAAISGAGWAGAKISDKLFDAFWSKLTSTVHQIWNENFPKSPQIAFVELRTADKGVMRMIADDFHVSQLNCLIGRFHRISHLVEANQICFQGRLFAPPAPNKDISTEARMAGKPPPLQACDSPEPAD